MKYIVTGPDETLVNKLFALPDLKIYGYVDQFKYNMNFIFSFITLISQGMPLQFSTHLFNSVRTWMFEVYPSHLP